jgi:hypothetical protein
MGLLFYDLNWAYLGGTFAPCDIDYSHLQTQQRLRIKDGLTHISDAPAGQLEAGLVAPIKVAKSLHMVTQVSMMEHPKKTQLNVKEFIFLHRAKSLDLDKSFLSPQLYENIQGHEYQNASFKLQSREGS